MNEKAIIKKLQKGDLNVLKGIWDKNSQNVLNLAFRMLLDRDKAEDILMDVFVSIPDAIKRFRGDSAISTWLYTLTKNACLMKLRSDRCHFKIVSTRKSEIEEHSTGKEDKGLSEPDKETLFAGLSVLTPEIRSLLWLKDAEGLDIKTLAEMYKAPEGTLKARLSRARAEVRKVIEKENQYA
ncbi:MAG: sigma-70 family RNA polymerase sigma factor [Fibrobacteraceae bacterium]|nr:sigma-70 family RNA polymerase sigma factor [Fibrobacteraceae bacterium]